MQHFIGVVLGFVAAYILLWLFDGGTRIVSDATQGYVIALVVGAIVALAWPWVIGLILVRRAKGRRDDQIQKEVQKQVDAQNRQG
jgi:uncharacterized membrane protein (DUF485 family)